MNGKHMRCNTHEEFLRSNRTTSRGMALPRAPAGLLRKGRAWPARRRRPLTPWRWRQLPAPPRQRHQPWDTEPAVPVTKGMRDWTAIFCRRKPAIGVGAPALASRANTLTTLRISSNDMAAAGGAADPSSGSFFYSGFKGGLRSSGSFVRASREGGAAGPARTAPVSAQRKRRPRPRRRRSGSSCGSRPRWGSL